MLTVQRATRGLVSTAAIIGLSISPLLLARPGDIRSSSDGQPPSRAGAGMPVCDAGNIPITESTDVNTIDPGLVCSGSSGTPGKYYGRSHDLSGIDAGGDDIELRCVKWAFYDNLVDTEIVVNVYADDDGDPSAGLTYLGSSSGQLAIGSDFYSTSTFEPGVVVPSGMIFIELYVTGSSTANAHHVGANDAGQSSPSWIRTEDSSCGIGSWTDMTNIGYPDIHWVEEIEVAIATPSDPCDEPLPDCHTDIVGPGEGPPDGDIDVNDVLAVISTFGNDGDGDSRPIGDCAPLPNGDCTVDVNDLLEVLAYYGHLCEPPAPEVSMNEFRTNHSGFDKTEYIEISGPPGTSLDGLSWIVIGDGTGDSPGGHLETVVLLNGESLDANGLWSRSFENFLENNDPVTHAIVSGLNHNGDLEVTIDLDLDDDGTLDSMPWKETLDCASLIGTGADELVYCTTTIGPDDIYVAVGGYRCPDGTGDWTMHSFNLSCLDTPGLPNACDEDDSDSDGVPDCADNCVDTYNPDQADCDGDGEGDACDIVTDCNSNGIPDVCEDDCNLNGVPDDCDVDNGTSLDCDANGIPDECDPDCNGNGVPDTCDIANGTSDDVDGNGVPDECEGSVLAINEVHADPAADITGDANCDGVRDGSQDEFVEIVNKTGTDIYLGGATLTDAVAVRHVFPGDTPILGDGCAVVIFGGGDPATFACDFGGSIIQVASTGYIGANNSGDTISLVAADGSTVLATMTYGSEGGDNQSLTRNPDVYGLDFYKHSLVSPTGALFSPGKTINDTTFGGSDCGSGGGTDTDGDGWPDDFDNCYLANPDQADCNDNGIGDVCDIADGTSQDTDGNGIPDECEVAATGAWINEFHYDNASTDIDEMIEVVLLAGVDSATVTVTLYNGSGGGTYGTSIVVGTDMTAGEVGAGYSIYSIILPANGLQNGAPDGICIDVSGDVAQFLSYEGTITATAGPAAGMTSTDVGVDESSSTPVGSSLGLTGTGGAPSDFTWVVFSEAATPGTSNGGQVIAIDP